MKQARVLTERDVKKVIDYIEAFDRHAERNRTMVLLCYYLGLRVCELAALRFEDCFNERGEVNDVVFLSHNQTKGDKGRRVFLNKKAQQTLNRYSRSNVSGLQQGYLFKTQKSKRFNTNALTQLLKRLYERAGIVGASSHSMRRTYITKLASSGVSVKVIAELVGHSNISTTQRYIDVNDDMLIKAVELL
jgi:integrase/recombinase XerD